MKQHTTTDQTAKLIELGFQKPINTIVKEEPIYREGSIIDWKPIAEEGAYSIGELIDMLLHKPYCSVSIYNVSLRQHKVQFKKLIKGKFKVLFREVGCEPINLLFNCIVKLKEKGVI